LTGVEKPALGGNKRKRHAQNALVSSSGLNQSRLPLSGIDEIVDASASSASNTVTERAN